MRAFKILMLLTLALSLRLSAQNATIDSLKGIVALHKNNEEECNTLNKLASMLTRTDMNLAKFYSISCGKLSSRLNYPISLSASYSLLVTIYFNSGMPDSAHFYLNKAKQIADNTSANNPYEDKMKMNYYSSAGLLYKMEGNFKAALPYLLKALDLGGKAAQSQLVAEGVAGQTLNIGNTYNKLGDYRSAVSYHLKALKLFLKINNQRGLSFCYQSIAEDFTTLGLFQQALPYATQAKSLKETLNDRRGVATACTGSWGHLCRP